MVYNLELGEFENNLFDKHDTSILGYNGVQYIFKFDNNYGASVIKNYGSYGYLDDLWEIGVLFFNRHNHYNLTYDTPITDNVIGYLTNDEVLNVLKRIKKLRRY